MEAAIHERLSFDADPEYSGPELDLNPDLPSHESANERLSLTEEIQLARRIEQCDPEALDRIVEAHLDLVFYHAYVNRNKGIEFEELVQEGSIGLVDAAKHFDYRLGNRFNTFAYERVRGAVIDTLRTQQRIIRIPASVTRKLGKRTRAEGLLHELLDRPPTDEELAEYLDLELRDLDPSWAQSPQTIDTRPNQEGEDFTLEAMLPDHGASDPERCLIASEDVERISEAVEKVMSDLDERTRSIVELYYGLKDEGPMSLRAVGERFGVTESRISQVVKPVREKLQAALLESEFYHPERKRNGRNGARKFRLKRLGDRVQAEIEKAQRLYQDEAHDQVLQTLEGLDQKPPYPDNGPFSILLVQARSGDESAIRTLSAEYRGAALIAAAHYVSENGSGFNADVARAAEADADAAFRESLADAPLNGRRFMHHLYRKTHEVLESAA